MVYWFSLRYKKNIYNESLLHLVQNMYFTLVRNISTQGLNTCLILETEVNNDFKDGLFM